MRIAAMVMMGVCSLAVASSACTLKTEDSSRYQEPIPQSGDVALAIPGSTAAAGASGQAATGLHTLGNPAPAGPAAPGAGTAAYYQFTRDVADAVDFGTATILGAVWLIVHTPPTSVTGNEAVWGPGNGNALDPVVWRLTVTEIATNEFDYELDGRPHLSTSDADFRAILKGHGYGVGDARHRSGSFVIDNDAYASLDPARASKDSGTVKVTFDARTYPITIEADVHHSADPDFYNVTVTHQRDSSGEVDITALGDVDQPPDGNAENVTMHSRWASTGAGRADVQVTGGSAPGTVLASECWGVDFSRTYYTDSVDWRPTSGDPASCAFPQASF
jgi:hypothetical protein